MCSPFSKHNSARQSQPIDILQNYNAYLIKGDLKRQSV